MKKITLSDAIRDIKSSCADEGKAPFFFIVGSGISTPNVPLASVMIEELKYKARERGITETLKDEKDPLEVYSYWFEKAFPDRIQRQRYLRGLIDGKLITPANMSLAHLVSANKISNLVVTTNFDDFLSRALALFGVPHLTFDHPVTTERIIEDDDDIKIVHVHGTHWFYDCCNLSGEVEGRSELSSESLATMAFFLDRIMSQRSPIVIGYSGWEGDVIMTSLRLRLKSRLFRRLYWFCYRREDADSLPDWLKNDDDVCFVLPREVKSAKKTELGASEKEVGLLKLPEKEAIEEVQSAETVFNEFKESLDLDIPPILTDPLGTFATRLRDSFPSQSDTLIEKDAYMFEACISKIEKANMLLQAQPYSDVVSRLQKVFDLVRSSRFSDAVDLATEIDAKELYAEQLTQLFSSMVTVAEGLWENPEQELRAYDLIISYGSIMESRDIMTVELQEQVARALFNKGITLGGLGRGEDALKAYDELIEKFGDTEEPSLQQNVAMALFNKGGTLGRLGRGEEEIKVYDEVIEKFGDTEEPSLQQKVAMALLNKGITLGGLGRGEEALKAYEELIEKFGDSEEPSLQEQVARALFNKGGTLGGLGRGEEAIKVYDEVIEKFGDSEEPSLQEKVARALFNKGGTLGRLGRGEEKLKAYDELIETFGDSEEPSLQEQVARALFNKGVTLGGLGRGEEALKVYDEVIEKFSDSEEPSLQEKVAIALVNKGIVIVRNGKYGDGKEPFATAVEMYKESTDAVIQLHQIDALAGLGRLDEARSIFDKFLERGGTDDKRMSSGFLDDLKVFAESDGAPEAMNEFYEYAKKKLG